MALEDDIEWEYRRQSEHEKRAIKSSWESFLEFAAKVVRITGDIIDIIYRVWILVKGF